MGRAEILALPPAIDLPTLGRAVGLSEPTIREQARSGRLDELGIKVVRLGAKYVAITSSLWDFLGIDAAADGAGSESRPQVAGGQRLPAAHAMRWSPGQRPAPDRRSSREDLAMDGDDIDRAVCAVDDLALAVTELAEAMPGDTEVSSFAGEIGRAAGRITRAEAAEARRLDKGTAAAVADPAVRAAAERTCAAFDDLADLIEPILGIDRAATIIPGVPETYPRYWTWKHFAEPHGTPPGEDVT